MLGDLNDDLVSNGNNLSTIISRNNFHQIIDRLARVTPQSATLLEVIVIKNMTESYIKK